MDQKSKQENQDDINKWKKFRTECVNDNNNKLETTSVIWLYVNKKTQFNIIEVPQHQHQNTVKGVKYLIWQQEWSLADKLC